jgi:lysozyme family protein
MTRTRFDQCLDEVLRHEGGYSDHPSDPGGATNMGITRKTLARWRKVSPWWNLPKLAVAQLARDEAARIYRASYWERIKAGSLPPGLDLAVFDYAVNSGPDRAVRALQVELGTVADGHIGPLTLEAVRVQIDNSGAGGLIDALCTRRLNFLSQLSTFSVFGRSPINHINGARQ